MTKIELPATLVLAKGDNTHWYEGHLPMPFQDKENHKLGQIVKVWFDGKDTYGRVEHLPGEKPHDPVNSPSHYTSHPSGVECVTIAEHWSFCLGNVLRYIWRAGLKDGADHIQDLEKAEFYLKREIARLKKQRETTTEQDRG
jgi:hypothetical protein